MANMFLNDIERYNQTAREWVKQYANIDALKNAKIQKLTEMGFTEVQARQALEKVSWDEEAAINVLIGG